MRYKLYWQDGEEAGEGSYAVHIQPGDVIYWRGAEQARVRAVIPVDDSEASEFSGLLQLEPLARS